MEDKSELSSLALLPRRALHHLHVVLLLRHRLRLTLCH
jgi:hypothetical protein